MPERFASLLVDMLYLYDAIGIVFALAFVGLGVKKVDRQAVGSGSRFRLLIFPGCAALWPLLLRRWLRATGEPPDEKNPHR